MHKLKELQQLEQQILEMPGIIGIGNGNINPDFIFLGQNPGRDMIHGTRVFSDSNKRSSAGVLLPILKQLGILQYCYFDNIVKTTTLNNAIPSDEEIQIWLSVLIQELTILQNNNAARIVAMGNFASAVLTRASIHHIKISHPARVLYGYSVDDYTQEIILKLNL